MKTPLAFSVFLATTIVTAVRPEVADVSTSVPFSENGVIVSMEEFFHVVKTKGAGSNESGTTSRALATATGIYSFLETPENDEKLGEVKAGDVVQVHGKLLERGALLHIEELKRSSTISLDLDLAGLRADPGLKITLTGTNKCQCGLDVGDLPHSCKLGHLHHLEGKNGNFYHYLLDPQGIALFLGQGSHFKEVTVAARLFPGNYIKVETAKLP